VKIFAIGTYYSYTDDWSNPLLLYKVGETYTRPTKPTPHFLELLYCRITQMELGKAWFVRVCMKQMEVIRLSAVLLSSKYHALVVLLRYQILGSFHICN
jgi:hypothetical protein